MSKEKKQTLRERLEAAELAFDAALESEDGDRLTAAKVELYEARCAFAQRGQRGSK